MEPSEGCIIGVSLCILACRWRKSGTAEVYDDRVSKLSGKGPADRSILSYQGLTTVKSHSVPKCDIIEFDLASFSLARVICALNRLLYSTHWYDIRSMVLGLNIYIGAKKSVAKGRTLCMRDLLINLSDAKRHQCVE